MVDDNGFAGADWLLEDEAIAHIRACVWYRKDGTVRTQLPLSMVARAHLQNALEDRSVHARGPLRFPHGLRPEVPLWLDADIPSTFWPDSVWDGRSGFRNRSSSEFLPYFEVHKKELYELWPEADRVPMPAPFDVDWPPLPAVLKAMTQRLDVSRKGAHRRLIEKWQEKKIKASLGRGSHGSYIFDEWEEADPNALRRADSQWGDEFGATGTNGGRETIVLCGDDVVAVWPRLVITESGEIAPPLEGTRVPEPSTADNNRGPIHHVDRFPGRPSVKQDIVRKLNERVATENLCDSLNGEAKWLYEWAHNELRSEKGLPSSVHTVENLIRKEYRRAKFAVSPPTK
jgi:hypothetical protein